VLRLGDTSLSGRSAPYSLVIDAIERLYRNDPDFFIAAIVALRARMFQEFGQVY